MDVLILAGDETLRDWLLEFLPQHTPTVVSSPAEVWRNLEGRRFALVILTNFRIIGAASILQAVTAVPDDYDAPVLFLAGYLDAELKAECSRRRIPWRRVPITPEGLRRELRLALDS